MTKSHAHLDVWMRACAGSTQLRLVSGTPVSVGTQVSGSSRFRHRGNHEMAVGHETICRRIRYDCPA